MLRLVAAGLLSMTAIGLVLSAPTRKSRRDTGAKSAPTIRVNVTPAGKSRLTIAVDQPFVIRDRKSGRVLYRGNNLVESRVTADTRGIVIARLRLAANDVEITPRKSPAVWVGRHQYRGTLRLHRQSDGSVVAVNVVSRDAYLASVINGEMPAAFPVEARKAQAVVARSYALYRQSETRGFGLFDVYADSRSQRYPGYQYRDESGRRLAGETAASRKLVRDTAGLICTYRGKLFSPYYCAVCGGRTTAGQGVFKDAVGCLQSVPCRWCRPAKRYRWTTHAPLATVNARLRRELAKRKLRFGNLRNIRPAPQRDQSKPPAFLISDGQNQYQITAAQLRDALPDGLIASPSFTARLVDGQLRIAGRGHGHGVGMCQWGAAGQARAGRLWREILRYYYPGTAITAIKPPK